MAKIIDLSKTIEFNKQDPWFMRIRIKHKSHAQGASLIRNFIGLPKKLFPSGFVGWADDSIQKMGVHATTHIDAPWHYGPQSGGKPAKTIDEIPLDWCYGDGVLIDMSHKADHDPITVEDLNADLEKSGAAIAPGNIVLIRTGRDIYSGTSEYPHRGTGMSRAATEWLIDKGIRVMGIDAWGWDVPLMNQAKKAKETSNAELFWEGHTIGLQKEYCHMEQLVNLGGLPAFGFKVAVFPLKIRGASAAPARVVAIFE